MARARRLVIVTASVLLGVIAGAALMFYSLVVYQPAFYEQALVVQPDPVLRKAEAKKFVQSTLQLVDEIKHEDLWSERFTEDQVNSWLAEELHQKFSDWVPPGVSNPRVKFDRDLLQLAFRAERGHYMGVISGRFKPWVAGPNQLAIEVLSIRAGLLPIPLDDVLAELKDEVESLGWRIEFRQTADNDVVVIHLPQENGDDPILETITVAPGTLQVSGSRRMPTPRNGKPAPQLSQITPALSATKVNVQVAPSSSRLRVAVPSNLPPRS